VPLDKEADAISVAIVTSIEIINTRLKHSGSIATEALRYARRGERNKAIGALAGLDSLLREALSLYEATLVLHRTTPFAERMGQR
jgi:hypothetical protein